MSQVKAVQTYKKLSDPNNEFMRELTMGGEEGLKNLKLRQIHRSIAEKHAKATDTNEFLNSLEEDEYQEFIQTHPENYDIDETGRYSIQQKYGAGETKIQEQEKDLQQVEDTAQSVEDE